MKRKARLTAIVLLVILGIFLPGTVSAYTPYQGYQYNSKREVVPAPASYTPSVVETAAAAGGLNGPQDLFVDQGKREIYLADTGNNRIVVLDENFQLRREYRSFSYQGKEELLNAPAGIFVSKEGRMYIADRDNGRILIADQDGTVEAILGEPQTDFISGNAQYAPEKIVVDSAGRIYVQARGMYQGVLCMDETGKFLQFFGSNRVELTAGVLVEQLWQSIMTKEQQATFSDFIPVEYSNLYIDEEDFIYAVVKNSETQKEQIKKINSKGLNILHVNENALLATNQYGDPATIVESGISKTTVATAFVDIHVDEAGFVYALDLTKGRVFVYDQDSNPLTIFGGLGEQQGLFSSPTAVESLDGKILVLDGKKNSITVFTATDFGLWMQKAIQLYNDGLYVQSQDPWNEVLKRDMNNELAYTGIGKALYGMKEYEDALDYFRLGYDKVGYSKAYREYRNQTIRSNFGLLILGAAVLLGGIWMWKRLMAYRLAKLQKSPHYQKAVLPFRTMLHPFQGYDDVKWNGKGSIPIAGVILLAWFVLTILNRQLTGFIFAPVGSENFNSLFLFAGTVVLFVIAVIANWSISTLVDCEGNFREIFISCSYALMPMLVVNVVNMILSQFLVMEEGILMTALSGVSVVWSILLLEIGFITIHQVSFKKAITLTLSTILGVAIILFLIMLLFSLCQQVTSFVYNIYNEIRFRL